MNQRAVTWGDVLRQRSGSHFVGRRHEVEAFRLNCLYDVPQSLIFAFQGPPGIGKTELVRQYGIVAREHGVITVGISCDDVVLTGPFAIIEVMAALAQQLARAGVPLTTFQEILGDYRSALSEMDPMALAAQTPLARQTPEAEPPSAGTRSAATPRPPGHLWALFGGINDDDVWVQRAWDEYLIDSVPVRRSRLVADPVGALTERFVQDLNAWATVRKVVLSLDDWHQVPPAFDDWLQDLLVRGELSTNIWFILAGRRPLRAGWERLASVTMAAELSPLSRPESRVLLMANDVRHTTAVEQRLDLAAGNPFALLSLAKIPGDLLPPDTQSPAYLSAAVTRYLTQLKPNWRTLFLKCAAARRIDAQVLAVLLNGSALGELLAATGNGAGDRVDVLEESADDGTGRLLTFLRESPLIVSSGDGLRFHPAAVDAVSRWAQETSDQAWLDAHQRLYATYRQRVELHNGRRRYLDPVWQHDQSEALYHALVVADLVVSTTSSPETEASTAGEAIHTELSERLRATVSGPGAAAVIRAVSAALLSLSEAILRFSPWAGSVVRLWREAAQVCDPVGPVATWLAEVESLYAALLAGDWEQGLSLLEGFLSTVGRLPDPDSAAEAVTQPDWSPDLLQALRTLQQLTASRLALPPEPEYPGDLLVGEEPARLPQAGHPAEAPETQPGVEDEEAACLLQDPEVPPVAPPSGQAHDGGAGEEAVSEVPDGDDEAQREASAVEHCGYANAQLDAGDYESAIQAYDQALALNPAYVAAYYNRGLAFARLGALDRAIADFSRVLELDDTQATAYHQRGLTYARKGAIESAVADYNAALDRVPGSIAILYARANAHFRMHAYERAIADYSEVLRQDATRVDVFLNRGLARVAAGDHREALRDYNQAIALDPERALAYSYRGQAYVHLERHAEALADYDRAIDLDPRNATTHNNRGLLYVQIEAYGQAIEAYQQAMALQPDWATPYYNAACAAALLGEVERAAVWLSRAVGLRERYRAMAQTDPDFAQIRETPQFRSIVGGS